MFVITHTYVNSYIPRRHTICRNRSLDFQRHNIRVSSIFDACEPVCYNALCAANKRGVNVFANVRDDVYQQLAVYVYLMSMILRRMMTRHPRTWELSFHSLIPTAVVSRCLFYTPKRASKWTLNGYQCRHGRSKLLGNENLKNIVPETYCARVETVYGQT